MSIDDIAEEDFTIVYSYPGDVWIGLTKANVRNMIKICV